MVKCPVEGCPDSEREFQKPSALKAHIKGKHPEFPLERLDEMLSSEARQVPIVEEDFATLLTKFKIKGDQAFNISENISHTGGPRAFEDPEILIKRLSLWSSEISPGKRNLIVEQWFAERGVDIPPDVQLKAGMTTEQLKEAERATKDRDPDVRYIYDTDVRQIRMAREGERGGTLAQARELKRMAEEENESGKESPFIMDGEGNWALNPNAKVGGVELMAYQALRQAQERGEPFEPIAALTKASEQMRILKESFGGGGGASSLPAWMTDPLAFTEAIKNITGGGKGASPLPAWMTDPLAFTEAIKNITGGKGEDSALKESLTAMQQTIAELKEDRWRSQFEAQQKQIGDLASVLNKTLEAIADMKKERVGRTEMDILHEIATEGIGLAKTELPGLRRDLKEAVGAMALPSPRSAEQREDRKKKFKQAVDTDRDIEEIGRRVFFGNS